jgi:hypothetical protein
VSTPTRTTDQYVELLVTAGHGINAVNAATVGTFKGLVRHAHGLSDAELLTELRRLADAHDKF